MRKAFLRKFGNCFTSYFVFIYKYNILYEFTNKIQAKNRRMIHLRAKMFQVWTL